MTRPVREHPDARAELRAAANSYDDPATGQELLDASLRARHRIAETPEAWRPIRDSQGEIVVRRKTISGFPYGVIYYATKSEIVVVAYAHEKRKPGYWMDRLSE